MSPARKATSARSGASSSSKAKKSTAKKPTAKKTTAKKTTAKKAPTRAVKKAVAKPAASKKAAAPKKSAGPNKTSSKKTTAKKATPKKSPVKAPLKKPAAKSSVKKTVARPAPAAPVAKAKPVVKKPVTRPAPPAPPKKKIRAAKFTPDQLKKIKASLAEQRIELEERKRELDESTFDATQSDISGEVGLDDDFADAGTATFERERDLSIRNNIRDLIDQVIRASQRIDDGTYGTCERCSNPIDASRLRELPRAALCLDCKRREERAR